MKESFAEYLEKFVFEYLEYSKDIPASKEEHETDEAPKIEDSIGDAQEILKKAEDMKSDLPDATSLASIVPLPDDWANEVEKTEVEKKPRKKSAKNFVNIPRN